MKHFFKLLPLTALLASASLHAEEKNISLPDLVVNSDFPPTSAQQAPLSVTTVDPETIKSRGAGHIAEVLNSVPNINFSSGSSRGRYFQIRGIGERSQFATPLNPSVGLIVDGIDFSRSGGSATLFDIEQVDILRGPQGTTYGANGLAGVINLTSKEATQEVDVDFQSTFAQHNTKVFGLAVGGPLIDNTLLGRFAVQSNKSDGYINNRFLDRDDTADIDETTVRTNLKWLATDTLTFSLKYLHLDIDNGYDNFTFDNSYNTLSDEPGRDSQKTNAFSLKTDWAISPAVKLESIITHSNSDIEYSFDVDWTYVGFDPAGYSQFNQYLRDRENNSIDVRLLSDEAGRIFANTTDWVIGIYHAQQDEDLMLSRTGRAPFESSYDTKNTAVYGQLDTALSDKLTLISGLRVEWWDAEYKDSNAIDTDTDDTFVGGKIGLTYQFNQNQMAYTHLSRGYKAGGVNPDDRLDRSLLAFDAEYLWNLEAGLKSQWFDGRVASNISVFYAERKDQQVSTNITRRLPSGITEFIPLQTNAAEAKNYGLEATVDWLVNENWRLFANIGLLKAEFDTFDNPKPDAINVNGRDQAHAPNYQFSVGTEHFIGENWTVRANVEGKDSFYFSNDHNYKTRSYALVNASVDYQVGEFKVSLWGRNLFDKEYEVRGFGTFGNNPANGYVVEKYTQLGEPRVIGVTFNYDY